MIYFISQKYFFTQKAFSKVFWVIAAFVILKSSLLGQEKIDYRGVWQVKAPDSSELILIVKRNNLASYFRADNADRTVHQGSWSNDAEGATLTWKDGSTHQIKSDLLGYKVTHVDASRKILYTTTTTRLPEETLGQWAKGPSRTDEESSNRDQAKGFFGIWQIEDAANPYYLVIEPNRSAATDWTQRDSNSHGLRGSWAKQGSELHIAWDTGHYGILKQNDSSFTFRLIAPGNIIEKDESNELPASRIDEDSLTGEWHTLYTNEKQAETGGVAFTNRKDATSFYRGPWIIQRSGDTFERIEIGRFGGLKTSIDSTLYGNWRMSGQDIFMNWDDGLRKILSPVGNGFLLYEYKPGRPIDGVPTRIFSATPENARKLAEHMEGRKEVARKLLNLAEDAGVTSSVANTGWGQTFMRWAWPFSDSDPDDTSSDSLLQVDSESSENIDPWWWPFWSENPPVKATESSTETERNTVKIVMDSASTDIENNSVVTQETTDKRTKSAPTKPNWDWPF